LVNARYAKNVPGRKTDVSDAAWLRQLHSYGLLRGDWWNTQPASAPTVRPERFKKKQISPIYGYPVLSFLEMPLAFPARSHMKVDMKARCYYGHRRTVDIMTDIKYQHPFWAAHHLLGVCASTAAWPVRRSVGPAMIP
jgi:hypothetical protein